MGLGGARGAPKSGGAGANPDVRSGPVDLVTPQCAGGLALELMLGTVGTGASECARCGAVGAAGVGVGAANGADNAVSGGPSVAPNPLTSGGARGAFNDGASGPGRGAVSGVGSGATSEGTRLGAVVAAETDVLRDKLLMLLKLSLSRLGL